MSNLIATKTVQVRFLPEAQLGIGQLDEYLGLASIGGLRAVFFKEHFQPPATGDPVYCSFELSTLVVPPDIDYVAYGWNPKAPDGQRLSIKNTFEHGSGKAFQHPVLLNLRLATVTEPNNPVECIHACDTTVLNGKLHKRRGNINCIWPLGRADHAGDDWLHQPVLFQLRGDTEALHWPGDDTDRRISRYLLPGLNTDCSLCHLAIPYSHSELERALDTIFSAKLIGINDRLFYDDNRAIYFGRVEEATLSEMAAN